MTAANNEPAADEPLAIALQRIWRRELAHLQQQIPGVVEGRDSECLHQFRVALRRSRALLRVLEKSVPPHRQLAADLKALSAATGSLRDLDVHCAGFEAWLGADRNGAGADVAAALRNRRERAHAELVDMLNSDRCRDLLQDWSRFLAFLPTNPSHRIATANAVQPLLRRRVGKLSRNLCRRGQRIDAQSPDRELHRMRIHGKRLRYLLETFAPVFPRRRRLHRLIAALKDLQTVLGDHQDSVVARELFRSLVGLPELGTEAVFTLGRWDRELEQRRCDARRAFGRSFAAFARACRRRPWRH